MRALFSLDLNNLLTSGVLIQFNVMYHPNEKLLFFKHDFHQIAKYVFNFYALFHEEEKKNTSC
jgi:hypothetical protein